MQVSPNISYFNHFSSMAEAQVLELVLRGIKRGEFQKGEVLEIRDQRRQGKEYGHLKRNLSGFTPSGTFSNLRREENLLSYSKILVLDIDKLSKRKLSEVKSKAKGDDYTYAVFESPSGTGLKILVKVDSEAILHKIAFQGAKDYYESLLGVEIDKSGKDITRFCFVSYDPDLYLNKDSKEFEIVKKVKDNFERAIQLTQNNYAFEEGQRNNFIYTLACYCNQLGIPEYVSKEKILSQFGNGDGNEFENAVKSAYSRKLTPIASGLKKGDPIENYLLSQYDFRFNKVRGIVEVKDKNQEEFIQLTDRKLHSILRDLKLRDLSISKNRLIELLESDFTPDFHPMISYLESLPKWDGKDHLGLLSSKVSTDDDEFFEVAFKKWFVAMIACAIDPAITNQWALIFSGGQGIGKSTFIRKLLPPALSSYHYSGMIDPKSKDTLIHLAECFIIDLDELSNLTRKQSNEVKEMITKDKVRVRKPYGKMSENLPRHASFIGSINEQHFLSDITGNRRFLSFQVERIDYKTPINHEGIFAQAFALYQEGFEYYFEEADNKMLTERNEKFRQKNLLEDLISNYVPAKELYNADYYLNAGEFLQHLSDSFNIKIDETNNIKLGKLLTQKGFRKTKKKGREVYAIDIRKSNEDEKGQLKLVS